MEKKKNETHFFEDFVAGIRAIVNKYPVLDPLLVILSGSVIAILFVLMIALILYLIIKSGVLLLTGHFMAALIHAIICAAIVGGYTSFRVNYLED